MRTEQWNHNKVLAEFLKSTLELNRKITAETKRLTEEGGHDERKLTHYTIRAIQEWFRLHGNLPL